MFHRFKNLDKQKLELIKYSAIPFVLLLIVAKQTGKSRR